MLILEVLGNSSIYGICHIKMQQGQAMCCSANNGCAQPACLHAHNFSQHISILLYIIGGLTLFHL
jgi:hypothetical protein